MKNEKIDDFYLQDPIFSPQIEDLSIKIYNTNFCDFFCSPFISCSELVSQFHYAVILAVGFCTFPPNYSTNQPL